MPPRLNSIALFARENGPSHQKHPVFMRVLQTTCHPSPPVTRKITNTVLNCKLRMGELIGSFAQHSRGAAHPQQNYRGKIKAFIASSALSRPGLTSAGCRNNRACHDI